MVETAGSKSRAEIQAELLEFMNHQIANFDNMTEFVIKDAAKGH
jgi:hypothetical protein